MKLENGSWRRAGAQLDGAPATGDELAALALVNYGHFTSMRVDAQRVRGLSHHLDRLAADCRTLFDAELDREMTREFIRRVVADRSGSFVVRVTIFDPALRLSRPGAAASPRVLVTTRPAVAWPLAPMRVQSVGYVRDLPRVKHVGLFGPLRHRRRAQLNGFDDTLFTAAGSLVTEGGTWNIGFFDGENVVWPDAEILPGVTMRLLQQAHERTVVTPVTLAYAATMKAAYATNAGFGIRAITAIDDVRFPADHSIMKTLREEYSTIPMERI